MTPHYLIHSVAIGMFFTIKKQNKTRNQKDFPSLDTPPPDKCPRVNNLNIVIVDF